MRNDIQRQIVDKLRQTKKYRNICDDSLYRVANWAVVRYKGYEAVKAAKRKLHQIYGAYFDQVNFAKIEDLLKGLPPPPSEEGLRMTCREILKCHASTAERIAIMADFYPALFRKIGQPKSVLDLACGLNPFALPWMSLRPDTDYYAVDIDHRLISAINSFFTHLGRAPTAECKDILVSVPKLQADVILILKSLPCLEQQEKGVSAKLLEGLVADYVVVSFPTGTLGGRNKGMYQYYDGFMARVLAELHLPADRIEYPNEVFYVIEKTKAPELTVNSRSQESGLL